MSKGEFSIELGQRSTALVDWSHEGQKHQHPSGTSWSGGWALVRGVELRKAAQESASG